MGRPPKDEDELNPGSFGVCQLYHISDVGDPADPLTYRELWNTTITQNEAGTPVRVRCERGPIFNKNGGLKPDWDTNLRVPVFIMTLDDQYQYADGTPFKTEDVLTGKFLEGIKYFLTPIKERIRVAAKRKTKRLRDEAEDLGGEIAEKLWWKANRPDTFSDNTIAYKHVKHQVARNDYCVQNDGLEDIFESKKWK
jgi:hypothetical protein